jgi:hypothetical protein
MLRGQYIEVTVWGGAGAGGGGGGGSAAGAGAGAGEEEARGPPQLRVNHTRFFRDFRDMAIAQFASDKVCVCALSACPIVCACVHVHVFVESVCVWGRARACVWLRCGEVLVCEPLTCVCCVHGLRVGVKGWGGAVCALCFCVACSSTTARVPLLPPPRAGMCADGSKVWRLGGGPSERGPRRPEGGQRPCSQREAGALTCACNPQRTRRGRPPVVRRSPSNPCARIAGVCFASALGLPAALFQRVSC